MPVDAAMMSCVNAARHQHRSTGTAAAAGTTRLATDGAGPPGAPASPPARRHPRPSWRDPRIVVGVVMVAASMLLGARLLAGADDTVTVWSAGRDLPAGTTVSAAGLQRSEVRFASEELAERYLSARALPAGTVLLRDVAAGELLPRAALGTRPPEETAQPIALSSDAVPADLRRGELVDVWVTPPPDSGEGRRAVRVLGQVRVVAAPESSSALGPSSTRQVVVGVSGDDDLLARALAQLADGTAVLVRKG
jgi:hypothetical protein